MQIVSIQCTIKSEEYKINFQRSNTSFSGAIRCTIILRAGARLKRNARENERNGQRTETANRKSSDKQPIKCLHDK